MKLDCKLEWKRNFYPLEVMESLSWGCYPRNAFSEGEVKGVRGAWVNEGVCPIHGIVMSMLGGIPLDKPKHPCGAYKE